MAGYGASIASKLPPPDKLKAAPAGEPDADDMGADDDMAAADGAFADYLSALGVDMKGVDIPAATAALRDYLDAAGYVRK